MGQYKRLKGKPKSGTGATGLPVPVPQFSKHCQISVYTPSAMLAATVLCLQFSLVAFANSKTVRTGRSGVAGGVMRFINWGFIIH
jgi:hypothetical protein